MLCNCRMPIIVQSSHTRRLNLVENKNTKSLWFRAILLLRQTSTKGQRKSTNQSASCARRKSQLTLRTPAISSGLDIHQASNENMCVPATSVPLERMFSTIGLYGCYKDEAEQELCCRFLGIWQLSLLGLVTFSYNYSY